MHKEEESPDRFIEHFGSWFKANSQDAGYDLRADCSRILHPGEIAQIPVQSRFSPPRGSWGLILGRSSLNARQILAWPSVIDCGYTGPIRVILQHFGDCEVRIQRGARIAQVIFLSLPEVPVREHKNLKEFEAACEGCWNTRKDQGWGSSNQKQQTKKKK